MNAGCYDVVESQTLKNNAEESALLSVIFGIPESNRCQG